MGWTAGHPEIKSPANDFAAAGVDAACRPSRTKRRTLTGPLLCPRRWTRGVHARSREVIRRFLPRSQSQVFALIITVLLTLVSSALADQPPGAREKYNFNPGWKVFVGDPAGAEAPDFDDAAWKSVTLPYAWNEDSAFKVSIRDLPTGIAWYRKHFTLPAGTGGKKVFLEFEGIRQAGEFYVNGKFVGRSENGVMAFGLDVTDAVRPAPATNVVAARIDNAWNYHEKATGSGFQWNDRNFYANYGGINKNVVLHITDKLYQTLPLFSNLGTTGVYVYAQDFDVPGGSAKITAEAQVRNEYVQPRTFGYGVTIRDRDGKTVGAFDGGQYTLAPGETRTVSASGRLSNLHFWSWGYGYLYDVETTLTVDGRPTDTVTTRTGFRKTQFDHGVLTLNDRVIQVKGYGQRTTNEWPAVGLSVPAWVSDFSNRMLVEGNGNLVRWMHVTPWKQDVESFDRLGLMESMPAGDSEGDPTGRRWDLRLELMRDAIIYNRNDPSIVFYEGGNKGLRPTHMQQMHDLRVQWDPHGGRAMGSRDVLGSQVAEYGGEMLYINKSATKPLWQMEYSRDEALRKWWDEFTPPFHSIPATQVYVKPKKGDPEGAQKPSFEYNRNQDSQAIENVARWYDYWHERPGTGTRVNAGGVKIIFSDSNTHFRGAQNYRRSGAVDPVRLPKDAYFADQVMWDGWVDVEHPRVYIIGHWNYAPGTKKNVYVVSSADKVELSVNGRSLGFGAQSSRFLFTFKNVAWEPGVVKAFGSDAAGRTLCTTQKETAGAPAALRLTPHTGPGGLRADGADLALVDIEVVDAQGRRCPTALNPVAFSLSGPGEWRGGIAQDDDRPDNYILSKTLPVQCGVNRVIVRSTPQAGRIVLQASAQGLRPASLEIESHAVSVADGLFLDLPGASLPANLERGPTPSGPSFTPTRIPLPITSATAGSNADKAALSFDDDETTAWASDGKPGTAWIQYDLARPAVINEVTLKMSGWRQRSYPVRLTVDGKTAYTGATPRSLGYVTLTFAPVTGKSLKIELTGATSTKDAFGGIVEVTGKKDTATPDTGAPPPAANAKGTLSIVEAEIYGPLGGN